MQMDVGKYTYIDITKSKVLLPSIILIKYTLLFEYLSRAICIAIYKVYNGPCKDSHEICCTMQYEPILQNHQMYELTCESSHKMLSHMP